MEGLAERLAAVRARIERAADRARRDPAQILLLAVTKIFPAEAIQEAYALGLRVLKTTQGLKAVSGRRFCRSAVSFDRPFTINKAGGPRLLGGANHRSTEAGPRWIGTPSTCARVKLSEEQPERRRSGRCARVDRVGTGVPNWLRLDDDALSEDPEAPRGYFRRLRELAEANGLTELSMGMSNDLETAIEEGSTCVRVGTALFGKRRKV
jgi:hypothetical protein